MMPRLCERPGCSTPADVAYGFDADALVVWLDTFDMAQGSRSGVLCRRHADSMVVPLGWMLDDRREPVPRLFTAARMNDLTDGLVRPRTRKARSDRTLELIRTAALQLSLENMGPEPEPVAPIAEPEPVAPIVEPEPVVPEPEPEPVEPDEVHDAQVLPWQPRFDQQDDLSGLLQARGRLLSRAFRGITADGA